MSNIPTTRTTEPPYFYQNEPVTSATWKAKPVSTDPTTPTTDLREWMISGRLRWRREAARPDVLEQELFRLPNHSETMWLPVEVVDAD